MATECQADEKNKRDLDIKIDYELETHDSSRMASGRCTYRM